MPGFGELPRTHFASCKLAQKLFCGNLHRNCFMTKGNCLMQLGCWGVLLVPRGYRAEAWWGSRGVGAKPLENLEILHFTVPR